MPFVLVTTLLLRSSALSPASVPLRSIFPSTVMVPFRLILLALVIVRALPPLSSVTVPKLTVSSPPPPVIISRVAAAESVSVVPSKTILSPLVVTVTLPGRFVAREPAKFTSPFALIFPFRFAAVVASTSSPVSSAPPAPFTSGRFTVAPSMFSASPPFTPLIDSFTVTVSAALTVALVST